MTNPKGVMSIATKVVIQINAKLGGEPWAVANPLKASNTMVIGFDVYHCGKRKGQSVGAMVATTSKELSKFYSTVSFHESRDELTGKMATDITKCLMAFKTVNGDQLPDRIIMFRDGVGDGQLNYVYNTELAQIKMSLKSVYESKGRSLPKFSLIIVTKKINARIALVDTQRGNICNPQAGTIVDDVITLPERWDFYLVAQHANQGTVSPTCYNVLFDQQGLDADKIQRFAYKLCHMYYNWSGTVAVPAPCQYAHKLAYLTGLALKDESKEALSHQLFYL
jgi:aubergine-like protein